MLCWIPTSPLCLYCPDGIFCFFFDKSCILYPDGLASCMVASFSHCKFPYMSFMFFIPCFSALTSLSYIHFSTLAWTIIDPWHSFTHYENSPDHLCGLVVRCGYSGYRSRGPGSIQIFWEVIRLERGPLSLVSTIDRLCGLVVRVPGYRSGGPGSFPGDTRFSEKWWCVWNGVHSASSVQLTASVV
jgi:hypothetical protein